MWRIEFYIKTEDKLHQFQKDFIKITDARTFYNVCYALGLSPMIFEIISKHCSVESMESMSFYLDAFNKYMEEKKKQLENQS